jgi:putative ATP-dependent endonuclease of OLD family
VSTDKELQPMKISHVTIQNYRSIERLDVDFDDYASFVGANGSGKSSVLYAVNWLINGGNLDPADVHSCPR